MPAQPEFRVVLESDAFGREIYSYSDEEEAFSAIRRLLVKSRSAFLGDGVERVIGIIVGEREDQRGEPD